MGLFCEAILPFAFYKPTSPTPTSFFGVGLLGGASLSLLVGLWATAREPLYGSYGYILSGGISVRPAHRIVPRESCAQKESGLTYA